MIKMLFLEGFANYITKSFVKRNQFGLFNKKKYLI